MSPSTLSEFEKTELLAGRVLGDLTEKEHELVESILVRDESRDVLWKIERTAAAVQLNLHHVESVGGIQPVEMPPELANKIRVQADTWMHHSASGVRTDEGSNDRESGERDVSERVLKDIAKQGERDSKTESRAGGRSNAISWSGWICTAAALLLAFGVWQRTVTKATPTAFEARTAMLASASSFIRVDWAPGKTPFESNVAGDVVWDTKSQSGFMRFVDMPVNDPSKEQYQLWIIDPKRDDEPIDGGVFNIAASGEVIVPIDAKLTVIEPAAFAITIEKPGGVVVSTQERLPLLAAVNG